jgi:ribonuclease BN (tRNA processing enzyme)
MQIRVLGCHGADQLADKAAGLHRCESCAFLIDDTVLLDAGTIGPRLTLVEQQRIRVVLLSHLHFDHIKGLPTLADNLSETMEEPLVVAAPASVIRGLQEHVFNDEVYPNFFQLPEQRPVLQPLVLEIGKSVTIDHLEVMPIAVNHTVPTVGYLVKDERGTLLYSGDTYKTDEIWAYARMIPNLRAAFIEASFPNNMAHLAELSKHLTPSLLAQEWAKLHHDQLPVYAYHLKPPYRQKIVQELESLGIPNLSILEEDQKLIV